jgi:hypothetical protein
MSFNGADGVWVVIAGTVSILMSVLWLYLAYRAVKAHERLASAAELMARVPVRSTSTPPR